MAKILNALILFIFIPSISFGCSITSNEKMSGGRCVDIGGYQMYMRTFGKSAPVVIVDSGSGDDSTVWNAVASQVSKFSRVVVYDRAGLGKSDLIIVLTATNHHDSEQREEVWQKWQRGITQISPKSMQIFAWGSGHYIQKEQPQLVVDAIYTAIQLTNASSNVRRGRTLFNIKYQ